MVWSCDYASGLYSEDWSKIQLHSSWNTKETQARCSVLDYPLI